MRGIETQSEALVLCLSFKWGTNVEVTAVDVWKVLGFSNSGNELELQDPDDDIVEHVCARFNLGKSDVSVGDLEISLLAPQISLNEFKFKFALFAITSFLCPLSNFIPSRGLYAALMDPDLITSMNWAKYILDYLINGIRRFKNGEESTTIGCMLFLMVVVSKTPSNDQSEFRSDEVTKSLASLFNALESKMDNLKRQMTKILHVLRLKCHMDNQKMDVDNIGSGYVNKIKRCKVEAGDTGDRYLVGKEMGTPDSQKGHINNQKLDVNNNDSVYVDRIKRSRVEADGADDKSLVKKKVC
ncbi:E3 ubiquitin-protein ligase SINA-like [Quillaja saponaria]|uniref:E3 ubiquitin-protein ligase SINA-like n=1 Tax=Quillaja saponaria TaxID=32244 RepID=A0AAD7PC86_QUISA|nr:E3 ubiquitin-protein ligase SINA-like [Quillaja saponaria]